MHMTKGPRQRQRWGTRWRSANGAVGRHQWNRLIINAPPIADTENTYLKGIGWGNCGEALAVVGSLSQLGQPKVSIVDGKHNAWLPQAIVVIVTPEGSACRKSGRSTPIKRRGL